MGRIAAKKLIAHGGSDETVSKEKKHNTFKIIGIGSFVLIDLHEFNHLKEAEKELYVIKENNKKEHQIFLAKLTFYIFFINARII